ncbi:MAG TPA: LamG-like jellyroll fold domain-containing protein, partial [Polyangiaceae bacterium]
MKSSKLLGLSAKSELERAPVRLQALTVAAVAVLTFLACSDSNMEKPEAVATAQSALSGGTDPVVRYSFNETSGTFASDSSGNGHAATLVGGATFVAGLRGNAVRIAGGSQRVDLPPGVVQRCDDLTIAARVNLAANSANWTRIFDFGSSGTSYMFLTPRAGAANVLRFAITNNGGAGEQQISHTLTFPTNAWKHVAVVLNGNTGTLYVDGAQVAQNTNLTLNPSALGATTNNWLGDSQFAADPTLNGSLDDVVVSCRPYSAAEIGWLASGSDPVAQYSFNETSGTTAADSSGNARNATLANGASFVAGLHGNAVQIAGGSQRVNLPPGIVQSCTDLTIAAHVRLTTNTANWARIFDIGANGTSYMMLTPRAGASNVLRFAITTGGTAAEQRLSHTFTFPTNTWKHVAVTLSGNTGTMYLDGVQVVQNTAMTLNPNALGATVNNWLGDSQFTADPTLNGTIDNLFVSCRPLSPPEIGNLAGACSGAANCDDNNPCTADTCSNGFCSRTRVADSTPCANATVCDGAETCQNGWCAAGAPPVVDDGNACTTDACDPVQGVTHTPVNGCGSGGAGGAGGSSGAGGTGAASGTGGTSGGGVTCPSGTTAVEMFIELPPGAARNTIALGSYGTPLDIHDRVRVLASPTTFASVSSLAAGPSPTRLGVESHVQNFWAEPSLELRDR